MMSDAKLIPLPDTLSRGCLGKLPQFPEFIRLHAVGMKEQQALDLCLQEGLYWLHRSLGPGYEGLLRARLNHRFVFRGSEAGMALVGVLRASRDSRGREFPCALYLEVPSPWLDIHPTWLLGVSEGLFRTLEQDLQGLQEVPDYEALVKRVARPFLTPTLSPSFWRRYDRFLDELTCAELEGRQEEEGAPDLERLLFYLRHLWAEGLQTALSLPLRQPRYAWSLELCFWLELVLLRLGTSPAPWSAFWPAGTEEDGFGRLWWGLRGPDQTLLEALLREDGSSAGSWSPQDSKPLPGMPVRFWGTDAPGSMQTLREVLQGIAGDYPAVGTFQLRPVG